MSVKVKNSPIGMLCLLVLVITSYPGHAQRQMEPLARGVAAVRKNSTQAYVSWRLLISDPAEVGFNLYRTASGVTSKLNPLPLTNTTDYLDTPSFTGTNAYFVRAVLGGTEQASSPVSVLPASAPTRQYFSIPLQPVRGGDFPPYDVKFCWVGDFDGDGEYDFLVDRLSTVAATNQFLQAYKRDGTFLWQMNMGHNSVDQYSHEPGSSAISVGHGDNVTVYDLDGDGKAEVIVRTANGVTVTNAATNQVASITAGSDVTQFISIIDGLTGVERARATVPNPYSAEGPIAGHMGIMYCDGVRPSLLYQAQNRNDSPGGDEHFNMKLTVWDFRNGALTQRWTFDRGYNDYGEGHQIRIADVDGDGKDEFQEIGFVVDDNGQLLWDNELAHGDRFHTTDIDPDRPGLETFAIQQYNTTLLATMLYDPANGLAVKKWYAGGVVDVGRGITLDLDPNYRGSEMYSTQPGIFDAKGNQIWVKNLWAPEALWWDGDVLREFITGAGSGALNPTVEKFDYVNGFTNRLYSVYTEGVHQAYGGRSAFWGDILGDWREELVLVANDYSEVRIYTTTTSATNRNYCLMQNPQYRMQATTKGYYQANYLDYYLGHQMQPTGIPTVSPAQIVWRGGGANDWDAVTANWFTNNLWISNTVPIAFADGSHVLFDLTGSNHAAINLTGSLAPGTVTVNSPKDYTFAGAGELTGTNRLVKAGRGKLTFPGTNSFTGPTTIWEGPFLVNGALPFSPVTVRGGLWHEGALSGNGFVGQGATIHRNAAVSPGLGTNSPGTLTISNGLALVDGAVFKLDLSDDPTGIIKTNDLVQVLGNLTLTGTNRIVIRRLNGVLPTGTVYPLVNYTGTLTGSISNLVVEGLPGIPIALTNPPGQIALVVKSYRAPVTLTWTGGQNGNVWDLLTTSNFLNGAAKDQFAPFDTVRLDNTGSSNLTVNLTGNLNTANVVVDSTANYTIAGSGIIMGGAGLTKSNTGTLTVTAKDSTFTGRTLLAGGTLVVSELGAIGWPSSLGNPPGGTTNLVFANSPTLRITAESYTDRGMTLNAGTNTIEITNASDQLTMAGQFVGSGALQKTGAGLLALTTANTYSGGTIIKAGGISLGGITANQSALGSGLVTLDGSFLRMYDDDGSWEGCGWSLNVPANSTGTVYADRRCTLTGSLIGGGTLNFYIPYVRTELGGNWSAFTGVINPLTTDSDGGDFRIINTSGYANATINLASLISAYHTTSGTSVPIGALSGVAGSKLSGAAWVIGAKNTNTTFAGNISGNSITKVGTATWTLTGSNSYTGTTTVSAGTLMVNGNNGSASGTVTVANTATLAGTGIIGGPTTVQSGGRLSPGNNAIGTLTFNGNLSFNAGSTSFIEINKNTGTKDLVDVGGTLTYGGTLQVTNLAGTLANGNSYKIFDASTYAGAFSSYNLPALAGGLVWHTAGLLTSGTLSVTNAAPAGPQPLTWKGDGAGNAWNVALTANWLDASNVASFFSQNDQVTFNDAGSNNTPVIITNSVQPSSVIVNATKDYIFAGPGSIAGTNGLIKSGSGALTLANANAYTGPTVINAGTINLPGLTNRWSFNGSLNDLVGNQTAAIVEVGANNATLTASNLTLAGGVQASSDYVNLGASLLPNSATPVTLELWATPLAVQNWSRIFDFGSGTTENLMMSWTVGTTLASDRVEWMDATQTNTVNNSNQPYTLGVEFHIVMVIEPGAGAGGTTRVTWYSAPATNNLLGAARGSFDSANTLANFNETGCWLGRSHWPDNTANASYNEVRIWNRSLSAAELQTLHAAGPDANLAQLGMGVLPPNTAVNLAGATAKLDILSGTRQVIGSLTGVAGSEVRLTTASLIVGGDNSSTSFGGVISGSNWLHKAGTGTLTLTGNNTFTGSTILTNGTLIVNGDHSAATGPMSVAGATLGGNGILGGSVTLSADGTLSPGVGIGALTFNNSLNLGGTAFMEISHSPLTNDVVNRSGALAYGGALVVSNTAGPLVAGDKFKLFNAPSYTGAFTSNSLPPLSPGLVWNTTKLNTSGTLWVVSTNPPTLSQPQIVSGSVIVAGTGGTPGWDYYVLGSTNVTLPANQWTRLMTNVFDVTGNCLFTNVVNPAQPQWFLRVQVP